MSERATRLLQTATAQVDELIRLFSTGEEAVLSRRCVGRERLGDGTVGACALHTADNYLRITEFAHGAANPNPVGGGAHGPRRHRRPAFAEGHGPGRHVSDTAGGDFASDDLALVSLIDRLSTTRDALGVLGQLTDEQLDDVPAASEMRFCDDKRTLEQIITSALNHQAQQVHALRAALA
jgi:hypothetical protein